MVPARYPKREVAMAGTFLLEGTGRDWSRVEALLIDRGLMISDASPLVPGRHAVCTADRTELVRVVLRGPWAGLERADLHFWVCSVCGRWILASTVPADLSSR